MNRLVPRTVLAAAALFLVSVLAGASPAAASSPRTAAFLSAMADGREPAIREFVRTQFSPEALRQVPLEERVERMKGVAGRLGRLELVKELPAKPAAASFVARSAKTGETLTITLELDAAHGGGIRAIRVEQGGGPDRSGEPAEPAETPKKSDGEAAAAADEYLSRLAAKDEFSGVVILARRGEPFFRRAYGLADRELSVANTLDTKFNVASIGKLLTNAALSRLIREGRLSLDDTIRKVLPDSKIPSADRITVGQLVTMRSGIGDFFGPEFDATPKTRLRTLADYLALFETKPLLFEPGKGREYSNGGYVVLGLMIEKISGRSYYDYVREEVLAPLGMTSTGWWPQDEVTPGRAVGYTRQRREDDGASRGGPRRSNIYTLPARGSSAGGCYSTAGDLLKLAAALAEGKVEFPEAASQPRSPKRQGSDGFAGGAPGVNALLEIDYDGGGTVVVLANDDPPTAMAAGRKLGQWMGMK